MLRVLRRSVRAFETVTPTPGWTLPDDAVWIELIEPNADEEKALEAALDLPLPTRDEMQAIELSSRLYQDRGAMFMTANILAKSDSETPVVEPVTFVLTNGRLVTIRYVEPRAFAAFTATLERTPGHCESGPQVFLGLLDAIVDRVADILEGISAGVGDTSHAVFRKPRESAFDAILNRLGKLQITNAKARDSLVSLARLISFSALSSEIEADPESQEKLTSQQRDVAALTDHATYVTENITFLLDAATGLISTEQNEIMKIFSMAAVVLMPPTLIAGIYGMNFHILPELAWRFGYPMALGLMLMSMLAPLWWFRRRGWL
ncbi:MAG: corA [Caulobacter sp.]|nr:corA [Caulobacter sp.]